MEESASSEIQLPIASINIEDQNTQKEANISGGKENKKDELVIEIREILERPEIQSSTQCLIYNVPHQLRKWNEEAYTPQVISIGPFHHKNERLKVMEKHKERYFRGFMNRSNIDLENLVGAIREMEENIRGCYEETIDLSSDRLVKMILVDVSFILELFLRYSSKSWTSGDPMLVEPRASAVMLDLLLLENQLPFFVIEKLYHIALPPPLDSNLLELSFSYFGDLNVQRVEPHPNVKIQHFTDLLRTFQIPPPEKLPRRRDPLFLFYSATQLYDAGVKFEVCSSESYFNIKFERGVLKIPSLELYDGSEVVIRNIMALEQTRYIENAYFTDYFLFMDSLIKTRKDVDLLCEKRILVNFLGDNNAIKSMTNNLNKGIIRITMSDDFFHLHKYLNCFYETTSHRWKALLIRTYFTSSSDFIYVVHTIFIMTLLTIIQAVCSIIQVAGPSSKPK